MNRSRALYHMVRADFLERVRRYSFLLTMGFSVYLGYAVYSGQVTLQLDKYRGVNNSAWLGSVVAMVGSVWLSLVGFYIVKNAIQRDRQTRVGQILATTPISRSFYTVGKALSNFAVLASMVLVLGIAAIVIQLSLAGAAHFDAFALLVPLLVFGLASVAVTAALAVLFESLPILRGGVGNILYFFLWTALLTFGAVALGNAEPHPAANPFTDYTGLISVLSQMQAQLHALDPHYSGGASFTLGGLHEATKSFVWNGIHWTPALLLSRAAMAAIAILLALFAALFFDRFDPARAGWLPEWKLKPARKLNSGATALAQNGLDLPQPRASAAHLTPLSIAGANAASRTRFLALVVAEFKLALRGHGWWWYLVTAGLFIACLTSPLEAARSGVILAAWLWPTLVWSQMGTREAQFSTGALIFSAPRAVPRQLLAIYAAGVLLALLTGGGLGLHLLFARDFAGLAAWSAGALFIPALALALGVATGSRKFFEALYTGWWYIGPLHHIRKLDFMGTTAESSTTMAYAVAAVLLVLAAYIWRKVRLAYA